ncbi:MAG: ATP synthase F1 subunit gamma [Ignavibacteriales bacterium]
MATLRDIKRRIIGIKSTQQITKAMKMVAAAKLRRAQENIINARPYSRKISEVITQLLSITNHSNNPLLVEREVNNVAVVIVTSDRGLCGGFNMNLIREATRLIHEEYNSYYESGHLFLYCIGKKGFDHFSRRKYNIVGDFPGVFSNLKFQTATTVMSELKYRYLSNEYDKVLVVYNEFKSVIQQRIVVEQLLPIPQVKSTENTGVTNTDYIYEPDRLSIVNSLLPKHLNSQIWRVLLESYASELGARMTAMDMATENAKELISSLQLKYNKERQAAITKEILEIVSGANALKGG